MTPELYEAICTVTRFPGRLHVPLIHHRGKWINAVTGGLEPWVVSVAPMAADRARAFADAARKIKEGLT